jgi:hypothetical protein
MAVQRLNASVIYLRCPDGFISTIRLDEHTTESAKKVWLEHCNGGYLDLHDPKRFLYAFYKAIRKQDNDDLNKVLNILKTLCDRAIVDYDNKKATEGMMRLVLEASDIINRIEGI